MNCPKCKDSKLQGKSLKKLNLQLDQCPSCKGIWFDENELGRVLRKKLASPISIPTDALASINCVCPRCQGELYEFCYPGTLVLIDSCKSCKGTWLDDEEWKDIKGSQKVKQNMICPKCTTMQPKAPSCKKCETIIDKYNEQKKAEDMERREQIRNRTYADDIPGVKGRLLRFIDQSIDSLTDYS